MKRIYLIILISIVLIIGVICGKNYQDKMRQAAKAKSAHDAFVGKAPKAEPAFNIMDYAKSSATHGQNPNHKNPNIN